MRIGSYKRILRADLLIAIFLMSSIVFSNTRHLSLTDKNEKVLISFKLLKINKIVTVAISERPDYIVYRFGNKDQIDMKYPQETSGSWNKFMYSYYLRGGGASNAGLDLNYLTFTNGNYTYEIYEEYCADDNLISVGIFVKNNSNQNEVNLEGDSSSLVGTLSSLRNSRIKLQELDEY